MSFKIKNTFLFSFLLASLAILLFVSVSVASRFGRTGFSGNPNTNNGSDCTACHAMGAPEPLVQVDGPAIVDAGSTHLYTVTLTGGPAVTGGVNISTSNVEGSFAGALTAIDNDLRLLDAELAHTVPKAFDGESVQFSFEWTAPTYNDDVTFYIAGNSSNGLLDLLGDGIGTTTQTVTVQNGTGTPLPPPEPEPSTVEMTLFASGMDNPVSVAHAGDSRLFAAEQPGRIRVIESTGAVLPEPFLDISDQVDTTKREQGLLGLAFHPDYAINGFFYINYTVNISPTAEVENPLDRTRISRFSVSGNANVADPTSEVIIMEFEQTDDNHNGGDITFGPDGYLYIASGDGGGGGDIPNNAQNSNSPLGSILRIDVDTTDGTLNGPDCEVSGSNFYAIPPQNAFNDGIGGAGCDEIYAMGLRNPWRMSFDRQTGDLWLGDVGQYEREEIDFLPAGMAAGANLGWRCYEGNLEYYINGCEGEYLFPVYDYGRDDGCSVTGGYVYRGAQNPSLWGKYFFSDFCNTEIRTLSGDPNNLVHEVVYDGANLSSIAAFAEDVNGELFAVSAGRGSLYRISEIAVPPPTVASVLVFHRTTGFRHGSIDEGIAMIERFGTSNGWAVAESEDANDINAGNLAQYDAVVFLNATGGDLLNDTQVDALVSYVQGGGGFVGIHGATDALYTNEQYETLLGVLIDEGNKHSSNNTAVEMAVAAHPANAGIANPFAIEDELYNFNYQPDTTYLLTVDESTYSGHNDIGGANHPLAWVKNEGEGCVFYSSLGHDEHLYSGAELMDLRFQMHIENGIKWSMTCQLLPTPTPVPTQAPTQAPTDTPVPTATMLSTDTPVSTATMVATNIPVPTTTAMQTATPVPTHTPIPAETPISTPTPASTAGLTDTPAPTETSEAAPTSLTAVPTATNRPLLTATVTPTLVVPTLVAPTPVDMTPVDMTSTAMPTAISTMIATVISTVMPTETPTPLNPNIGFATPLDGQSIAPGTDLYVLVTGDDSNDRTVQLYINDEFVREENFAPYEWGPGQSDLALMNLRGGTYVLRLVATDRNGLSTEEQITITVGYVAPVSPTTEIPSDDGQSTHSLFLPWIRQN